MGIDRKYICLIKFIVSKFCFVGSVGYAVKHIKINAVSLALGFCQKSVFLLRACADSHIMLR